MNSLQFTLSGLAVITLFGACGKKNVHNPVPAAHKPNFSGVGTIPDRADESIPSDFNLDLMKFCSVVLNKDVQDPYSAEIVAREGRSYLMNSSGLFIATTWSERTIRFPQDDIASTSCPTRPEPYPEEKVHLQDIVLYSDYELTQAICSFQAGEAFGEGFFESSGGGVNAHVSYEHMKERCGGATLAYAARQPKFSKVSLIAK